MSPESIIELIKSRESVLKPTHAKLCWPIVVRICKKMQRGVKFLDIKACDGIIIDGHHRYLASLLAGVEVGVSPSYKTDATFITDWNDVVFDFNDWDTEAKIKMLNELDEEYNKTI